MGFHILDMVVIAGIALLIFGPKTLQSLSHTAGRGMRQAREAKDKLMADIPMEEFVSVSETVAHIPLSPQQAARQIMNTSFSLDEKKTKSTPEVVEGSIQE